MPERGAEEIRKEISAERRRLDEDLDALSAEVRSLVPFLAAGLIALAVLAKGRGVRSGIKLIWKLI